MESICNKVTGESGLTSVSLLDSLAWHWCPLCISRSPSQLPRPNAQSTSARNNAPTTSASKNLDVASSQSTCTRNRDARAHTNIICFKDYVYSGKMYYPRAVVLYDNILPIDSVHRFSPLETCTTASSRIQPVHCAQCPVCLNANLGHAVRIIIVAPYLFQ